MAEVKWIKICTEIFDDESIKLIEEMPEGDAIIVIWFKLLIQAGKTNDCGYIYFKQDIPYTDEMLATVFKRPLNIIRLAIQVFRQFGMIEILDTQGIFISNWQKHQNIEGLEKIREQTRNRVAKYRNNKKLLSCNVTVTQSNATDKEIEIDKESDKKTYKEKDPWCGEYFERIFSIYQTECKNLAPITFEKRNREIREKITQFLEETQDNYEYFRQVCIKANELIVIANNKIDFKSLLNNHIGIMNDKYKTDKPIKKGVSVNKLNEIFNQEVV